MITAFFTDLERDILPGEDVLDAHIAKLPQPTSRKISAYHAYKDRLLRFCGTTMLPYLFGAYDLYSYFSPDDLQYTANGKPFFDSALAYNTAHSDQVVICAGMLNGEIGIDIEKIKDTDITLLKDHFTENEWATICNSDNSLAACYRMWVRKEALIKAAGQGVLQPLQAIEVSNDKVFYNNKYYYLQDIHIKDGYAAALATDRKDDSVKIFELFTNMAFS